MVKIVQTVTRREDRAFCCTFAKSSNEKEDCDRLLCVQRLVLQQLGLPSAPHHHAAGRVPVAQKPAAPFSHEY
jgi:hypothetical protein